MVLRCGTIFWSVSRTHLSYAGWPETGTYHPGAPLLCCHSQQGMLQAKVMPISTSWTVANLKIILYACMLESRIARCSVKWWLCGGKETLEVAAPLEHPASSCNLTAASI